MLENILKFYWSTGFKIYSVAYVKFNMPLEVFTEKLTKL